MGRFTVMIDDDLHTRMVTTARCHHRTASEVTRDLWLSLLNLNEDDQAAFLEGLAVDRDDNRRALQKGLPPRQLYPQTPPSGFPPPEQPGKGFPPPDTAQEAAQ